MEWGFAMNQRPLNSYASVGIVHFMAFPQCMGGEGPVLETLAHITEDPFFSAVEVTRISEPATRRSAAELLGNSGFTVGFGCQPVQLAGRLNLGDLDDLRRKAAIQTCLEYLEQAAELGATKFAVLSGADPGPEYRVDAIERLVDSLIRLGKECADNRISLCLETFDSAVDKKCLIGPNALAVEVSQRVREQVPDFGLIVDLSHLPLQGERITEALAISRDHLSHVHIGNCVLDSADSLYGDQHPRFGYRGGEVGVTELREFLMGLLEVGYLRPDERKTIAFEVKPVAGESSASLIAHSKRSLLHAWSTIYDNGGW